MFYFYSTTAKAGALTHAHIPRAFIHKDTQQNFPYKVLSVVMRKNHPLAVERTMKMR